MCSAIHPFVKYPRYMQHLDMLSSPRNEYSPHSSATLTVPAGHPFAPSAPPMNLSTSAPTKARGSTEKSRPTLSSSKLASEKAGKYKVTYALNHDRPPIHTSMVPAPLICNKLASQECTWKSNMSSLKQKYSPVFPSKIWYFWTPPPFFFFCFPSRQTTKPYVAVEHWLTLHLAACRCVGPHPPIPWRRKRPNVAVEHRLVALRKAVARECVPAHDK